MKPIWAPWRMEYILGKKPGGCIFCDKPKGEDEPNHILFRGDISFIMMNIYPYNNGHIMVAPYKHSSCLTDLDRDTLIELILLTQKGVELLRETLNPDGFNTGINIGRVAGAGFEDHVHIHIVPRWDGDTSYMSIISETRVIPEHLNVTYQKLLPFFRKIGNCLAK